MEGKRWQKYKKSLERHSRGVIGSIFHVVEEIEDTLSDWMGGDVELTPQQRQDMLKEGKVYDEASKTMRIIPYNLANVIINKMELNFMVIHDETTNRNDIFVYKDGYYVNNGENMIRNIINDLIEEKTSEHLKRETLGIVKDIKNIKRGDVEPPPSFINFKNGILDINTMKLEKHDPKKRFLNQIPVNYNPKAECEKIKAFFSEVLIKKDIPTIQEMFGYCMLRSYPIAKAFILYGDGRNGKGVTTAILQAMLGGDNYSSRKLHDLMSDKFAKADLYTRLANIAGEMSYEDLKSTDSFKELTGQDPISAERKYHGTFKFKNYAKLIFNTNRVPYTHDKTHAFYSRVVIIPYLNTFATIDSKTDPEIYKKLTTKDELEGLVIWALEGLKRVSGNNKFSNVGSIEKQSDMYEDMVNTERTWLQDFYYTTGDEQDSQTTKLMYELYEIYCNQCNIPLKTRRLLTDTAIRLFKDNPKVTITTKTIFEANRKVRYTTFHGIRQK